MGGLAGLDAAAGAAAAPAAEPAPEAAAAAPPPAPADDESDADAKAESPPHDAEVDDNSFSPMVFAPHAEQLDDMLQESFAQSRDGVTLNQTRGILVLAGLSAGLPRDPGQIPPQAMLDLMDDYDGGKREAAKQIVIDLARANDGSAFGYRPPGGAWDPSCLVDVLGSPAGGIKNSAIVPMASLRDKLRKSLMRLVDLTPEPGPPAMGFDTASFSAGLTDALTKARVRELEDKDADIFGEPKKRKVNRLDAALLQRWVEAVHDPSSPLSVAPEPLTNHRYSHNNLSVAAKYLAHDDSGGRLPALPKAAVHAWHLTRFNRPGDASGAELHENAVSAWPQASQARAFQAFVTVFEAVARHVPPHANYPETATKAALSDGTTFVALHRVCARLATDNKEYARPPAPPPPVGAVISGRGSGCSSCAPAARASPAAAKRIPCLL